MEEYSFEWKLKYTDKSKHILELLGENLRKYLLQGSTSVSKLAAKSIIYVMAVGKSLKTLIFLVKIYLAWLWRLWGKRS
ncbi:GrpB family protein [Actinomyces sp. zg-332]|uniref:GrpB family protein n=1 Tax=Actinomyces sp. zg-332 TaxID=2708340 RepID=UPI0014240DD7|nr:GrpB family protein [Actinomyces sp. zg-332]